MTRQKLKNCSTAVAESIKGSISILEVLKNSPRGEEELESDGEPVEGYTETGPEVSGNSGETVGEGSGTDASTKRLAGSSSNNNLGTSASGHSSMPRLQSMQVSVILSALLNY